MPAPTPSASLIAIARAAFPPMTPRVDDGARLLEPAFNKSYCVGTSTAQVADAAILVPQRIHFRGVGATWPFPADAAGLVARCLCTRSTDGFVRHAAVRGLLERPEPWIVPFVVPLAGEYLIEVIDDLVAALPRMDIAAYVAFVRENRGLMALLNARAISYWNEYHRHLHPDRRTYPGCVFLARLEAWAT
jgi:hypothetical protein